MTHKYGIEVPTSVEHERSLDKTNGNHLWMEALAREMANVGVTLNVVEHSQPAPVGWSKAAGHLVWDVKVDFTRKVR